MSTQVLSGLDLVRACIRDVHDFPKPGIIFKDITPLLKNHTAREVVIETIGQYFSNKHIEAVAAIEARGFLFGMAIAQRLRVPFVPVRKAGKLPFEKRVATYDLEYGSASIEMHSDALVAGSRVLIHDDVLATGGTAAATAGLVQTLGGLVAGFSFVLDLHILEGSQNLNRKFGVLQHSVLTY